MVIVIGKDLKIYVIFVFFDKVRNKEKNYKQTGCEENYNSI